MLNHSARVRVASSDVELNFLSVNIRSQFSDQKMRFWVWHVCSDSAHPSSSKLTRPEIWPWFQSYEQNSCNQVRGMHGFWNKTEILQFNQVVLWSFSTLLLTWNSVDIFAIQWLELNQLAGISLGKGITACWIWWTKSQMLFFIMSVQALLQSKWAESSQGAVLLWDPAKTHPCMSWHPLWK